MPGAKNSLASEFEVLCKQHDIPLQQLSEVVADMQSITEEQVKRHHNHNKKHAAVTELSPEHHGALAQRTKKAVAFTVMMGLYVLVGGAIYSAVELPVEQDAAREFDETVHQLRIAAKLQDSGNYDGLERQADMMDAREDDTHFNNDTGVQDPDTFEERIELVLEYAEDKGEAPSEENDGYHWSLSSACFFAFTVVTTIGYGSFAPATRFGRLFTIPYGMGGLVLTGYTLSLVGSVITLGIEVMLFRCFKRTLPKGVHLMMSFIFFLAYMLIWAGIWVALEQTPQWDYVEAVYYCFITMTTIGFGDYVPDDKWLFFTILFIYMGLGFVTSFINSLIDLVMEDLGEDDELDEVELLDEILGELSMIGGHASHHFSDAVKDELRDEVDVAEGEG